MIVDTDLEEMTASGKPRYAMRLRAKNLYLDAALCTATVTLDVDGREPRIERSLGTFEPRSPIRTFEWNLGDLDAKPLLTATTPCKWIPTAIPPRPDEE
ncbi:MAG: hypothetical protein AMXMBFR64_62110 [Myxococcales bacterium]